MNFSSTFFQSKHLFLLIIFILGKRIKHILFFQRKKTLKIALKYYLKWQFILVSPKIQPFSSKQLTKENGLFSRYRVLVDCMQVFPWNTQTCITKNLFPLYLLNFFLYWITDRGATYCIKYSKICKYVCSEQPQIYSSCLESNLLWTQTCSLHLLHAVGYIPRTVIMLFQKILKHGLYKLVEQNVLSRSCWYCQYSSRQRATKCWDAISLQLQKVGFLPSFFLNLKNVLLTSPKEPI